MIRKLLITILLIIPLDIQIDFIYLIMNIQNTRNGILNDDSIFAPGRDLTVKEIQRESEIDRWRGGEREISNGFLIRSNTNRSCRCSRIPNRADKSHVCD